METIDKDLKYKSTDNSQSRVYYTANKALYCFQLDWSGNFELLQTSKDGEPSHSANIARFKTIELSKGNEDTDTMLNEYVSYINTQRDDLKKGILTSNLQRDLNTILEREIRSRADELVDTVLYNGELHNGMSFGESMTNLLQEDDNGDEYIQEVYQWYIVTDMLAEKLDNLGCVVVKDYLGLNFWGRTTVGQSITVDYEIQTIFNEYLWEQIR